MTNFQTYQTGEKVYPIGDIEMVAKDQTFIKWMADSKDLKHYQLNRSFSGAGHKQMWIFKYLTLCRLNPKQIQEFCEECMEQEYPMFQKNAEEQVSLIKGTVSGAVCKGTFPKVRQEHIDMEELLND